MNPIHWMFKQYMAPEGDDGASNGGAPATSEESNDSGGVDWAELNEDVAPGADEGAPEPEVELDDGAHENEPTASEAPPDPNATTPEAKPAEPVTPIQDPAVVETPEQQAAKQAEITQRFQEWQQSETQRLVKEYQFDEDTAARLQTEPELVLPELAAKMQMNMTQQIVEIVQRMMPSMVQPVLANNVTESKAQTFFAEHNPDIDFTKHQAVVLEAGKAFRKMNPKATPEEAAKGIGQIARIALGIQAPATPPSTKAKAPHRPAAAGSRGAPAPKASGEPNKWAGLVDDD